MPNNLKIIFAGTPDFAADILADLISRNEHTIAAVYTQPDRQAGRGQHLTPSSVKKLILDNHYPIPIEQPDNFKKRNPNYQSYIQQLKDYHPDLILVVAYGLILPQAILDIPKYGCINIHASLLPRWRGAAPIQRAILAGDTVTGLSIQQMDAGLDTGDVIAEAKCTIANNDTSITLANKLQDLTYPLLAKTLSNIASQNINLTKQDDNLATYAHKIDKSESNIDFSNTAAYINQQIRAFTPWPGTQFSLEHNNTSVGIKVIEACVNVEHVPNHATPGKVIAADRHGIVIQCGQGQLKITKLQFSGGRPLTAQDALNGKFKDLFKP